jgi:hypothetical protein
LMIDGLGRIGGSGARFVARLLPTDIHEVSAVVDGDPQAVCERAVNLVTEDGELVAQRQPSPGVGRRVEPSVERRGRRPLERFGHREERAPRSSTYRATGSCALPIPAWWATPAARRRSSR